MKKRLSLQAALVAVGLPVLLSGPWYARSFVLYRNISGMQETAHGVSWTGLMAASVRVPFEALKNLINGSVWTGNSSFTSFGARAVTILLGGALAAVAIYVADGFRRGIREAGLPLPHFLGGMETIGAIFSTGYRRWLQGRSS